MSQPCSHLKGMNGQHQQVMTFSAAPLLYSDNSQEAILSWHFKADEEKSAFSCVLLRTKHLECKWINSTSCSKEENHVLNEIMGVISCQIESIKAEFQRILLSSLKLLHSQSCCTPQRSRWRALCEYYMSQIHPPVHAYTFAWYLFQQWNLAPTLTCLLEDEICLWQLFRPDEF